ERIGGERRRVDRQPPQGQPAAAQGRPGRRRRRAAVIDPADRPPRLPDRTEHSMSTRRDRSPLGSPILIGALTVLAVIVAVFLAYNANNGLPFVPSYTLHVQVADANELTHGAEVHMGGALVGFVDKVEPARTANGQPI